MGNADLSLSNQRRVLANVDALGEAAEPRSASRGGTIHLFKISNLYIFSILDDHWSRAYRFSVGNVTNSRTNLDVRLQPTL